jgi:hypothetical protein
MNIEKPQTAPPDREIPPPPGGGSWTFVRDSWEWISNDPVPADETPAAAVEYDDAASQE